ncbi:MAG: hypothetical protein M1833_005758 [Piccolia ochrophora]|nr:MAG: hypothetical protein M1833_005758 [Piccolia ochrophora]
MSHRYQHHHHGPSQGMHDLRDHRDPRARRSGHARPDPFDILDTDTTVNTDSLASEDFDYRYASTAPSSRYSRHRGRREEPRDSLDDFSLGRHRTYPRHGADISDSDSEAAGMYAREVAPGYGRFAMMGDSMDSDPSFLAGPPWSRHRDAGRHGIRRRDFESEYGDDSDDDRRPQDGLFGYSRGGTGHTVDVMCDVVDWMIDSRVASAMGATGSGGGQGRYSSTLLSQSCALPTTRN